MSERRLRTSTWPEIEAFYQRLVVDAQWPIQPMLTFVRFIAASPYGRGLFPATSHEVLLLGRIADFARGDNQVEVRFDPRDQTFTFKYTQGAGDATLWAKTCDADAGQATFERLMQKRLRWFHEG